MPMVYVYVVDRDFGFAPNPFHGYCTLATCKPKIRHYAMEDDWVIGMGGGRLGATGRCIFAMQVSQKISFNEYWGNPIYNDKKPIRNGSKKMLVGDNIYHHSEGIWHQLDSHHSNPDGTPNEHNIVNDTQKDSVLLSNSFYYFGSAAVLIPVLILENLPYINGRNYRKFTIEKAQELISFIESNSIRNYLYGDPFDFNIASARYSAGSDKVTMATN